MNKPALGVIRISAAGALFEAPYFEDADFDRTVIAIRTHHGYQPQGGGVYIPYRSIDWVVKVPGGMQSTIVDQTAGGEFGRGQTRQ